MMERAARVAVLTALALFLAVGAILSSQPPLVVGACLVVAAVTAVALHLRSIAGWPLAAGSAVVALAVTVMNSGSSANVGWFALCVLVGWCAL